MNFFGLKSFAFRDQNQIYNPKNSTQMISNIRIERNSAFSAKIFVFLLITQYKCQITLHYRKKISFRFYFFKNPHGKM